jgi:hypothetical protein
MKEQLLQEMREGIDKVVSGEIQSFRSGFLPPSEFVDYIEGKYSQQDDFDTNGWDYDYWIRFTINDKKYTVYGSGYYGGVTFAVREY